MTVTEIPEAVNRSTFSSASMSSADSSITSSGSSSSISSSLDATAEKKNHQIVAW
jgi:hypothetical protein